jgi:hypothetical protein
LSLSESFIIKTNSNSLLLLETTLEKNLESKYYLLSINQAYASLLAKE